MINLTQEFEFENDDLESIEVMTRAIALVIMRAYKGGWRTLHYSKHQGCDFDGKGIFICRFEQYVGDPENFEEVSSPDELATKTMEEVRGFNLERLNELPHEQFYKFFDGSTGLGFRLEYRWDSLWISAVHIYYGK